VNCVPRAACSYSQLLCIRNSGPLTPTDIRMADILPPISLAVARRAKGRIGAVITCNAASGLIVEGVQLVHGIILESPESDTGPRAAGIMRGFVP